MTKSTLPKSVFFFLVPKHEEHLWENYRRINLVFEFRGVCLSVCMCGHCFSTPTPHPSASPLCLLFRSPGWFPLRFVRKVNELSPSPLSFSLPLSPSQPPLSPVGETACHKANEVHLLTKRGGLPDTLIKCVLETEVGETEGSSLQTCSCGAMSRHRSTKTSKTFKNKVHSMGKVQHLLPNTGELFHCVKSQKLKTLFCNQSWVISLEMNSSICDCFNQCIYFCVFFLSIQVTASWMCLLFGLQSSDHHCNTLSEFIMVNQRGTAN